MEKIEDTEMNGDNWYIKRHPKDKGLFIVKHITVFGTESQTVDSLIEAMKIIDKFKNQEDWILQKREEFDAFMLNNDDFRKDATSGT
tara:strand:- start:149 stop:409 length:261 start_codon:yes stop_codon:yes gene_type:complete